MIKIKDRISKMQKAVWRMKDSVYRVTKNMGCEDFFDYMSQKSRHLLMDEKNRLSLTSKPSRRLKVNKG